MTEDEAKAKWCPFGRIAHVNGATANSRAHNDPDLAQDCIGSACMAWRWHDNDLQRCRIPDGCWHGMTSGARSTSTRACRS